MKKITNANDAFPELDPAKPWMPGSVQVAVKGLDWTKRQINNEIIDRALKEIGPSKETAAKCRHDVDFVIWNEIRAMYHRSNNHVVTWHPIANKKQMRALKTLIAGAEKVDRALKSLPPEWQEALFSTKRFEARIKGKRLCFPSGEERLNSFGKDLQIVAARATTYTKLRIDQFVAGAGELIRGADSQKRYAANGALKLLTEYSKTPPTLTIDGQFYNLASILYEAITGNSNEDLQRQCRAAHRHRRRTRSR